MGNNVYFLGYLHDDDNQQELAHVYGPYEVGSTAEGVACDICAHAIYVLQRVSAAGDGEAYVFDHRRDIVCADADSCTCRIRNADDDKDFLYYMIRSIALITPQPDAEPPGVKVCQGDA